MGISFRNFDSHLHSDFIKELVNACSRNDTAFINANKNEIIAQTPKDLRTVILTVVASGQYRFLLSFYEIGLNLNIWHTDDTSILDTVIDWVSNWHSDTHARSAMILFALGVQTKNNSYKKMEVFYGFGKNSHRDILQNTVDFFANEFLYCCRHAPITAERLLQLRLSRFSGRKWLVDKSLIAEYLLSRAAPELEKSQIIETRPNVIAADERARAATASSASTAVSTVPADSVVQNINEVHQAQVAVPLWEQLASSQARETELRTRITALRGPAWEVVSDQQRVLSDRINAHLGAQIRMTLDLQARMQASDAQLAAQYFANDLLDASRNVQRYESMLTPDEQRIHQAHVNIFERLKHKPIVNANTAVEHTSGLHIATDSGNYQLCHLLLNMNHEEEEHEDYERPDDYAMRRCAGNPSDAVKKTIELVEKMMPRKPAKNVDQPQIAALIKEPNPHALFSASASAVSSSKVDIDKLTTKCKPIFLAGMKLKFQDLWKELDSNIQAQLLDNLKNHIEEKIPSAKKQAMHDRLTEYSHIAAPAMGISH